MPCARPAWPRRSAPAMPATWRCESSAPSATQRRALSAIRPSSPPARGFATGSPHWSSGAEFVTVLGGCCALIPGVAAALRDSADGPLGLAYIDGHMDTYTTTTSPTGEAADMPIAMVAGAVDPELTGLGQSPADRAFPNRAAGPPRPRRGDRLRRADARRPGDRDLPRLRRRPGRPGMDRRTHGRAAERRRWPVLALDRRRRALERGLPRHAGEAARRAQRPRVDRAGPAAGPAPGVHRA